ncbi:MAG: hypothetical protein K8T25_18700 [Planctomycetia bacterium]|nr:hypothetical protein [Planctomycetia bacterium]
MPISQTDSTVGHPEMSSGIQFDTTIHVLRTPDELYRIGRQLESLPTVIRGLISVTAMENHCDHPETTTEPERSRWMVQTPNGRALQWDVELQRDVPNELIVWRTLDGADWNFTAALRFEVGPDGHGTIVALSLNYDPQSVLSLDLERLLNAELQHFKQQLESGTESTMPEEKAIMPEEQG